MKLHELPKLQGSTPKLKRVGRGYGSGKGGHTTGRGTKGQKARSKLRPGFEGGQNPLYKRLPKASGFKPLDKIIPVVLNIRDLEKNFEDGAVVSKKTLLEKGLISAKDKDIKILGNGDVTKKYKFVGLFVSNSAKAKIEKAGGEIK
jgi:large subunit ribosomal protein L15